MNIKEQGKSVHTKKQLKKELEGKMESALPEIRTKLGEKKFHRRIKKAAKIIVQGLHNKDIAADNGKTKNGKELNAVKKTNPKKAKQEKSK